MTEEAGGRVQGENINFCLLPFAFCLLFPVPCSLRMSKSENDCYKILRAVINAQHNAGQCFAEGS
ncbi:MAG: hypothetical protein EAZ77_05565 [Nostocales cyanobacterium]|nr:MAG: hypothetical protein EAZ77_05565 [Nostocales cyanobacterium]